MERCPQCKDYSLCYDPKGSWAVCTSYGCGYVGEVVSADEYYHKYVISALNWDNYCACTPLFVRELRGTKGPV